jgi:hypothetical protein
VVAGIPWCVLVIACAATAIATGTFPLWWVCVAIAAASVLCGCYLTYALLVILKEPCPLCLTQHAAHTAILVLLLFLGDA